MDVPREQMLERLSQLTTRELEVLQIVAAGKTYDEVAAELFISSATVQTHMVKVYEKLGLAGVKKDQRRIELGKYYTLLGQVHGEPIAHHRAREHQETPQESSEQAAVAEQPSPPPSRPLPWLLFLASGLALAAITAVVFGVILSGTLVPGSSAPKVSPFPMPTASAQSPTPEKVMPTALPSDISQVMTICGESRRMEAPPVPRFVANQGVSDYTVANTTGAVLSNYVRAIAVNNAGVWIGYHATSDNKNQGLGQFNKVDWANCNQPDGTESKNVNAIAFDQAGKVWVATETGGVAVFDGNQWRTYTVGNRLPSDQIFGLTVDEEDNVWVTTWQGVAKFDGDLWTTPYRAQDTTLFNDRTHAIAFDSNGNIWVGHISGGVSQYRNEDGTWIHHTTQANELGGDRVRSILVRQKTGDTAESVWVATADGGVSEYEEGAWTTFTVEDGLPSNDVKALAVDKYNRVWAATAGGVAYLENGDWIDYDTIDTSSIAFGPDCQDCPYNDDDVWTGTAASGLTHSRLPFLENNQAVKVEEVCFQRPGQRARECHTFDELKSSSIITATYSAPLNPGDKLDFSVVIAPRAPYALREDRGDFLSNTAASEETLYGTWPLIPVKETVAPGQPFTFTDFDNPLTAPALAEGETERELTSTWRLWMDGRYVGPLIRLFFAVKRP